MMNSTALIEARNLVKHFGSVISLNGVSLAVHPGEVLCLLGDNGAGKSTLIKTLSGVHQPTSGELLVSGESVSLKTPRDALDKGIATVYQDLAMIPLMSVARNFFMGQEPTKGFGPLKIFDNAHALKVTREEMLKIGIDVRDPEQAVGTLSGGERQCVAIARAVYFGAKVLILDEPTSALGVRQTAMVLRYINQVRDKGLGVIFITHNVRHAHTVGDKFVVLKRGTTLETLKRGDVTLEELYNLMGGGDELSDIANEVGRNGSHERQSAAAL